MLAYIYMNYTQQTRSHCWIKVGPVFATLGYAEMAIVIHQVALILLLELKSLTYINAQIYQICSYHFQLTVWLVLAFICLFVHLRCLGPVLAGTVIHNSQHAFTHSQVAKGGALQLGTPTKGLQTDFADYWCMICLNWYELLLAFWSITDEKSTYRLGLG